MLILSKVDGFSSATKLLSSLSDESRVPLSTLKLNAKVLKSLKLIEFENGCPMKIMPVGQLVLTMIRGEKNE